MRDERVQNRHFYNAQRNRSDVVKIAVCVRHHNVKADLLCCLSVTTAGS